MDKLTVIGGKPLNGTIRISGAKNAALPLMCASLLTDETLCITNLPDLADIKTLSKVLAELGIGSELNHSDDGDTTLKLKANQKSN